MSDRLPLTQARIDGLKARAFKFPWVGQGIIHDRHRVLTTAITEPGRPTSLIVTFDAGYHNSGWWKNSDYDKCLHVSLTHFDPRTGDLETPDDAETKAWSRVFFGEFVGWCWIEPPASTLDIHRMPNVSHSRLFYRDGHPILPEGEVYTLKPYGDSPAKIIEGALGGDAR